MYLYGGGKEADENIFQIIGWKAWMERVSAEAFELKHSAVSVTHDVSRVFR